jgi:hypothetical protein
MSHLGESRTHLAADLVQADVPAADESHSLPPSIAARQSWPTDGRRRGEARSEMDESACIAAVQHGIGRGNLWISCIAFESTSTATTSAIYT